MPVPYIGNWHFTGIFPQNFKTRVDAQFSVGEISCEMTVHCTGNWHFTGKFPIFCRTLQKFKLKKNPIFFYKIILENSSYLKKSRSASAPCFRSLAYSHTSHRRISHAGYWHPQPPFHLFCQVRRGNVRFWLGYVGLGLVGFAGQNFERSVAST